jgi:hypothetical protein
MKPPRIDEGAVHAYLLLLLWSPIGSHITSRLWLYVPDSVGSAAEPEACACVASQHARADLDASVGSGQPLAICC